MWNGFFNLRHLSLAELKQMFKDALELSTGSEVHILRRWRREDYPECSPEEYIEKYITLGTHNVVIDRKAYYSNHHLEGEISSSTLRGESLYLFIYLTTENLYNIVDKYKLTKR